MDIMKSRDYHDNVLSAFNKSGLVHCTLQSNNRSFYRVIGRVF